MCVYCVGASRCVYCGVLYWCESLLCMCGVIVCVCVCAIVHMRSEERVCMHVCMCEVCECVLVV